LDIVKRSAGFSVHESALWMIDLMCGGIPPAGRKIQPPDECQRIIDDDDLLMVGRADGMDAVLHGMQSPVGEPACIGGPFAFNAVNQMMIPSKYIDLQVVLSAQKFSAKLSDLIGESVRVLIDGYSGPAVEIPSKNHDALPSAGRRCTEGTEVCGTIDKEGDTMRVFDAPTVSAGLEMMCGYPILNDHDEYRG
jgi:hypothetical protein